MFLDSMYEKLESLKALVKQGALEELKLAICELYTSAGIEEALPWQKEDGNWGRKVGYNRTDQELCQACIGMVESLTHFCVRETVEVVGLLTAAGGSVEERSADAKSILDLFSVVYKKAQMDLKLWYSSPIDFNQLVDHKPQRTQQLLQIIAANNLITASPHKSGDQSFGLELLKVVAACGTRDMVSWIMTNYLLDADVDAGQALFNCFNPQGMLFVNIEVYEKLMETFSDQAAFIESSAHSMTLLSHILNLIYLAPECAPNQYQSNLIRGAKLLFDLGAGYELPDGSTLDSFPPEIEEAICQRQRSRCTIQ